MEPKEDQTMSRKVKVLLFLLLVLWFIVRTWEFVETGSFS